MTAPKLVLQIDGLAFATLEGFYDHVSARIVPDAFWGHNLAAFNDILRGGFGTPDEGFVLCWMNHDVSRLRLGHDETARHLRRVLEVYPERTALQAELDAALRAEGATIFDWLVKIIQVHCPGGEEQEDGVELVLR
jgi:hypothetical protein